MNETNQQSTQFRRTVVLDIETVALNSNLAKGALDALTGRIVCIGMLIDDGARLDEIAIAGEDEAQILTEFWNTIRPTDLLVGHNALEFDVPFLKQRSWVLNIRPTRVVDVRRFYTTDVKDTLQIWTNWGFKKQGVTLDALGAALECGQKSGHGFDVAQWWATRDLEAIKAYCLEDVRITYRIFCRLAYLEPRTRKPQIEPEAASISSAEQPVAVGRNRRRPRRDSSMLSIRRPA
jgi:predicted PolB exonuclease-like 3'-5' exonuclease